VALTQWQSVEEIKDFLPGIVFHNRSRRRAFHQSCVTVE